MNALLLAPHHDDEALFASYLCLKYKPRVIVCTTPKLQERYGVYAEEREAETDAVMKIFGCEWQQLAIADTDLELYQPLRRWLENFDSDPELIFAPAYEEFGNAQHNAVARVAQDVYGSKVVYYRTYARGDRVREGKLNEPDDYDWIGLKLLALSMYRSQLRVPNCQPWFYNLLDAREWIA